MKFLREGSMSDVYYTFQDIANNPDYSDIDAIAQIKKVMSQPTDDAEQFVARKLKLMHDTIAKHPSYKNDPMGVYEEMLDMIRTEYHDETYESKEMNPTTQTFSEDNDTNSLEQWKADVRKQYPQQASQIKFKGKGFGDTIVAEIPGKDQAFGEFNMETGDAWVAPMDEGVAEALDKEGDYHVSVQKGKFLPSDRGGGSDENLNYLHDLMNISGTGGGPMLVTISDPRIATEVAAMYGGKVLKTRYGTYRIVQSKGQNQKTPTPEPELVGMREDGVAEGLNKQLKEARRIAGVMTDPQAKTIKDPATGGFIPADDFFAKYPDENKQAWETAIADLLDPAKAKAAAAAYSAAINKQFNDVSWMTPEEQAQYKQLQAKDQAATQSTKIRTYGSERYLKQLFQQKMDAKKAAAMLKVHWAPLNQLESFLQGKVNNKIELSAYLAPTAESLGKTRWGSDTVGIVLDGHITIGGRGDLGSDQYKMTAGQRGQQKYASRPGQIDPSLSMNTSVHHEVLIDNWKIKEIVLPADIPLEVDRLVQQYKIPVRRLGKQQGVAESEEQLTVQQLATISDEALDNAYHYGRSSPGNTFGWQANLKSAAYAKQMIDKGITDIEQISDAIHKGWNVTAQAFVKNPDQFDDTAKLQAAGKLEGKLQQRAQLMKQNYAQLPDEEKEKDRVVARALLQALKGQQGVAEATGDEPFDKMMTQIVKGAKPNTPKRFIKNIKKVAKIKYKFQVGDWVTIDPNEIAKWPTSGMIGRISRFSSDGDAVVNVNPGGGASGGGSSGTHTTVPTSMLEKLAVNLDEPGVAEGSNPEKVEVRFSAKEYAAMSPAQKAAKQEEWQQLKQQAKKRMQNFTLIDTDKEPGVTEGSHSESDEELENFLDSTKPELDRLYKLAKTSKKAKAAYYELKEKWDDANSKLYGLDEQGVAEGSVLDTDTTGYTKYDMAFVNNESNQIKKIQAKLLKIPGFTRKVNDNTSQLQLAEKIFNLMKRGHTFDGALVLAQKNPSQQGVAEGPLSEKINPKTLTRGFVQEKDMGWYTLQAVGDFASRMVNDPPTMEIYARLKPEADQRPQTLAGERLGKQIGSLSLKIAHGMYLKNNPGAEALVAGGVDVDTAYQRKGVASAMYQFAKELGNDVIASVDQSDDAVAMWKGMRAKGVAEGSPNFNREWDEATRYPEFVNLGKEKWIELVSKGKQVTVTRKNVNKINNTDAADPKSFKLLDTEKQKRALAQLANGDVEMPIVARYSDGYLELIGGNTRLTAQMAKDGQAKVWLFNVPEELTQGVAEGSLNEFSINRGDGDDDDNRGPGLTRQEFKNALKLALGYDISGVDVSTFEGGMLRVEVNGERRIVPCNKLGVKDAAAFVKKIKKQGVAEGSSSPDEYKRRLASIQSLRYDNPQEYAKQYRALLRDMPEEHAAHANQAQKGSYSSGQRGSGTGSTGRVAEDSAQGTANKQAWDKGHEAGYTGNEKCPCKPGSAEEKAWNAGHKVGRDERSHERHGVKEGNMKSSANNPTGPSFAGGKWKGTDSAAQAKNKYVGEISEGTMPSVKLMRNIAEGLVRVDDLVLNRPVYGKPTDQDRRAVYRMVREFADAGIDYNDAVVELVEYFKHELSELAVAPTIPAVGGKPATTTTTAPTGTPSTTANTAAKTPDTVSSTAPGAAPVVAPPVSQQGVDALAQMVKNAGLSPSQLGTLMSKAK